MTIRALHYELNRCRMWYRHARLWLGQVTRNKEPRGCALAACRTWRNNLLTIMIRLRIELSGRAA